MRNIILLLLILITLSTQPVGTLAIVQTRENGSSIGSVYGEVYGFDFENNLVVLSSANVTAQGVTRVTVLSEMNGAYQLYLPTGTYTLNVSITGYIPQTTHVMIGNGSIVQVDFYLKLESRT